MDVKVTILGLNLGLGGGALKSLVGETVGAAAPVLDGILVGVTGVLGLHLGEADARFTALRCGPSRLVCFLPYVPDTSPCCGRFRSALLRVCIDCFFPFISLLSPFLFSFSFFFFLFFFFLF